MSTKGWVDKIRGLLQREVSPEADPPKEASPASADVPEPAVANSQIASPTGSEEVTPSPHSSTPPVQMTSAPAFAPRPPTKPRPPAQLHKVMKGDTKEQIDWSLRHLAQVGEQFLKFAQQSQLVVPTGLQKDEALLRLGYALVTLALKAQTTTPPQEALRGLRATLKSALLAALRKEYHKHATDETKLGASMVSHVDEELAGVDKSVADALLQLQAGATPVCAHFCSFLQPAFGSEADLTDKAVPELERLLAHLRSAVPVQDLLL